MAKILKSALFGGFRKKDVVEYLEELSLERQQEQAQWEKENRALADEAAALHTRLQVLEEKLEGAERETDRLREELTDSEGARTALAEKLEIAAAALEESRDALERQLAAETALRTELEEKSARITALEAENAACALQQERLSELEAELAARKEDLRALTAELAVKDGEKTALEAELARLRQPAETARRVVEAVPELVRTAVDSVPDSVKENLAETAENAKRKVVAIHRKVTEWSRKEQEACEIPEEDVLVDSEMAPEQPEPEYRPQPAAMTPEALLETCKTRLGEVAREFNDLYQAVVKLEAREQQEPVRNRGKLGHLSSIKEILDRVRSLGEKK